MKEKKQLPIYGIGPYYGVGVILTGGAGMVLGFLGVLPGGAVQGPAALVLRVLGIAVAALGFVIWVPSAFGKTSIDRYVETGTLCTTGMYRYVRNPCYAGIGLIFTGGLLLACNLWLLILPPLWWLALTLLVKYTEERWLTEYYGQEYLDYCSRVNRCIPWLPKNK